MTIQNTDICNICGEISHEIHIIFTCVEIYHMYRICFIKMAILKEITVSAIQSLKLFLSIATIQIVL